ncbi:hypothetical protein OXX69_013308, partial [Metschnikowia pulcherrima]
NLTPGASVLGQVVAITKVQLSLAIGDNLVGHVPITAISNELTAQLEKYEAAMESSDEEDEDDNNEGKSTAAISFKPSFPDLAALFAVGQWLRAVVTPGDETKKRNNAFHRATTHECSARGGRLRAWKLCTGCSSVRR